METQFRNLDRAIESQPMPPQFQDTKAMVYCNDCYAKSAVKYHWLGLKCAVCDSYNTAQISLLTDPALAAPATPPMDAAEHVSSLNIDDHSLLHFPRGRQSHVPGPARHVRHHSQQLVPRPTSSGGHARFSPYPIPQRLGRSVSPLRVFGPLSTDDAFIVVPRVTGTRDDDESDLNFWGGDDEPRRRMEAELEESIVYSQDGTDEAGEMDEMDDSEEEEEGWEDEGEEDDGMDDGMELFGHR